MDLPDIEQFDDLLSEIVGNNKDLLNIESKRLTAPGENYGSVMVSIKMTIQKDDEKEAVHNIVAKLVPPNEFLKKYMNIPYTFRNEYGFYKTIAPCLRDFQKEQGFDGCLDFFPKFYGGRLSLDPAKTYADDSAVILLENLKEEGFVMPDREVGFDLDTSKLILTKLAELHATALAFKSLRPDLFEEKFMTYFEEYELFDTGGEELVSSEASANVTLGLVEDDELCCLYIDRIKKVIQNGCERIKLPKNHPVVRKGTFTTFIHGDVWINNIMVKTYNNKVTDVKFLDLQLYEYHSITKDVLYFIFSAVETSVFKENVSYLINFYFSKLIDNLKKLQCDTEKFTYQEFMEEMKRTAHEEEYYEIMLVLYIIYPSDDNVWHADTLDRDKCSQQIQITEGAKKKGALITREFIQRGWI